MKLAILDREGTINADSDDFVKTPDEWVPLPGALEAIARLNHAGWHVVIASNQAGLGRGLFDVTTLNAINAKMHKALAAVGGRVDAVFYCPHAEEEGCHCRKPRPGLFEQIGERYGIDLRSALVVGDRLRDLQAGVACGCEPHFLLTGKGAQFRASTARGEPLPTTFPPGTVVHADLGALADFVIAREQQRASAPPASSAS